VQSPAFLHRPDADAVYISHTFMFQPATRFVQAIAVGQVAVMQPAILEHVVVHILPVAHVKQALVAQDALQQTDVVPPQLPDMQSPPTAHAAPFTVLH